MEKLGRVHPMVIACVLGFVAFEIIVYRPLVVVTLVTTYAFVRWTRPVPVTGTPAEWQYGRIGGLLGLILAEAGFVVPTLALAILGAPFPSFKVFILTVVSHAVWGTVVGAVGALGAAWHLGRVRGPAGTAG